MSRIRLAETAVLFCLVAFAGAIIASTAGCATKKDVKQVSPPKKIEVPDYLSDTVGQHVLVSGLQMVHVQGYGLVVGLDGTGTKVVPPGLRQEMLSQLAKRHVLEPERVLSSPDTAVVQITALMPPGIRPGETFDVNVVAVPNTETTSLEGGILLETDLTPVAVARQRLVPGTIMASARGEIFVAPFDLADKKRQDPRMGRIIGGARALKDRSFHLMLLDPSVRLADQIVRMINARFPGAATGTRDPSRVDITVPKAYKNDKTHFLNLVGSIYLREAPGVRERRIEQLAEAIKARPDKERVAIALEALGRDTAPALRQLIGEKDETVRFYAARTLARLDLDEAVRSLEPIAKNNNSPFQEEAVRALGRLTSGIGLPVLAMTLDCPNPLVRIAAYEEMKALKDFSITGTTFKDKFRLDFVPTDAAPFVFVSRRDEAKIVLFGSPRLQAPALIETSRILATCQKDQDKLVLITEKRGQVIKVHASLDLKDIIEKIAGPMNLKETGQPQALDLAYGDVVAFVSAAHRSGALRARVVLQPLEILAPGGQRPLGMETESEIETKSPAAKDR